MRLQSASYIFGAALCLTAPAWAQSAITPTGTGIQTTSTGTQTTSTGTGTQTTSSTSTSAFQNLSPGNQKIAQSLFDAQHPPTGTKALTLDQIAALKGKEGWGRVFKEMKSDGLVQARNLGQAVSGHARTTQTTSSTRTTSSTQTMNSTRTGGSRHVSTRTTSSRTPIVVTSGSGRSTVVANNAGRGGMGRGGSRFASNSSPHVTTAGGPSGNGGFGGGGHDGGGSSHGGHGK